MYPSRAWSYGLLIAAWFCCSSLLIGAQNSIAGNSITSPVEVTALRAIRESLMDPNNNLINWDRGDPCTSNWTGVICHSDTLEDGYLHVDRLQLMSMNLFGSLSPELGSLLYMTILDFMWNNIWGSIPKEIGNIKSLLLLLLNGNQLTGSLPEELGHLPKLNRIQIDQNNISGPIPTSFQYLSLTKHFHMNNNSISGQILPELSRLPNLVHFLLDNNKLSGYLPPNFSELPNLLILQLDNNNFDGTSIPTSYSNMSKLLKLDLSSNQLNGSIPANRLADNITAIYLSNNNLSGPIPANFSSLSRLQILSIANNSLNGSIPSTIWQNKNLNSTERLIVELQNNDFLNITGSTDLPENVSVWLQGNPLCSNTNQDTNLVQLCGSGSEVRCDSQGPTDVTLNCPGCPPPYEYPPTSGNCLCTAPLLVRYRLKSPGFSDFRPYENMFEQYLSTVLEVSSDQLYLYSFARESGPRVRMFLKLFPAQEFVINNSYRFNRSELWRIMDKFTTWSIPESDLFGPYELMNFILPSYIDVVSKSPRSTLSKGALAGIILGIIAGAVILFTIIFCLILIRKHTRKHHAVSKRRRLSKASVKIDGVKDFTYGEMAMATNNFNSSTQVGQGGYGKVYKGILADGTVVAIKRAQKGSLQGEKEFLTEIKLLSRLHHRNLVSLIGYCDEEGEQMLVYEFMPNGTLRDQLSASKSKEPLSFAMRLRIALGLAKGILYLHMEANPPVFHRDIKASNILLDSNYTAKVADFGLSLLAPIPDIDGTMRAHISTIVKGTPGYLDPEYFLTRKLTNKSDVYSLGVVFLELLTGMRPITNGKNIVREVNVIYQSGEIFSVIDEGMGSCPSECLVIFATLALKCCQDQTDARPSMAEVVRELERICLMMPEFDIIIADQPASSSTLKNSDMRSNVSGGNLGSGDISSIRPR